MINLVEFRKKTEEDLRKEFKNIEKEMQKVVSDTFQKKEKNVQKAKNLRKDLARILTLINEKKLGNVVIEKVSQKEKEVEKETPKKKEIKVAKEEKNLPVKTEEKKSLKKEKKVIFEKNLKSAEYRRKRKVKK